MKYKVFFILVLIASFSSCKKEFQKNSINTTETEEISLLDTLTLKLNNGEKWNVNNATQIGIEKMDSIISSFKSKKESSFVELGQNLSKQTSFIIKSCDMTGEAHDQLHVVLVPMLDEISIIKESENTYESRKALGELESLIEAYFNHFEN
jgi:hypothetical protein